MAKTKRSIRIDIGCSLRASSYLRLDATDCKEQVLELVGYILKLLWGAFDVFAKGSQLYDTVSTLSSNADDTNGSADCPEYLCHSQLVRTEQIVSVYNIFLQTWREEDKRYSFRTVRSCKTTRRGRVSCLVRVSKAVLYKMVAGAELHA